MNNATIAQLLKEIGQLLKIKGDNPFKIRAYENAVRVIENLTEPLQSIRDRGELKSLEGIGDTMREKINEALDTGQLQALNKLKATIPEGLLKVSQIPGMGPKKVKLVWEELNVTDVASLKKAADEGLLADLPGMGAKTQEKIIKGIQNLEQTIERHTLRKATDVTREILDRINKVKGVVKAEYAGSLRRGKETVGDIDILVATEDSKPVMEEFLNTDGIIDVLAKGDTKSSIVVQGNIQVDLRVVSKDSFGAALQYFTGSKEHNVKLRELAVKKKLKINEYGVYKDNEECIAGKTEEEVYEAMGLQWIPPELREGFDEIELAKSSLPKMIEIKDIISALHNHTTASDGAMSLEELVNESKKRGFKFIAVTDHSAALGIANGLSVDRLKTQIEEIREWNENNKFPVLAGNEVDVLSDGSMPYDDELLEQLDIVIASLHLNTEQPREKLMKRLFTAMEHPLVDIIAHPTGRLIGKRQPMDIDMEALYAKAAETGTILEINCHFERLDLKDQHIREAKDHGVLFSINTDTHRAYNFDNLEFGIKTARRGRLAPDDVVNTYTLAKFKKTLKRNKK